MTTRDAISTIIDYWSMLVFSLWHGRFWTYPLIPLHFIPLFNVESGYLFRYEEFARASAGLIRPLMSFVFNLSFLVIRPSHRILSIVLYRLAEAENGALAVLAAALAGVIKLLQMALKSTTGH
jgi:hypothetical protein